MENGPLNKKLDRQIGGYEKLAPNARFVLRGCLDGMPKHKTGASWRF